MSFNKQEKQHTNSKENLHVTYVCGCQYCRNSILYFFIRILTLILTPTIFLFNVYGMNEMKIFNHPIILYLLMNSRHLSKNTIIKCLRFSIFIKKLLKYLPIVILQKVIDINKLKIINHPIIPLPFEDHP